MLPWWWYQTNLIIREDINNKKISFDGKFPIKKELGGQKTEGRRKPSPELEDSLWSSATRARCPATRTSRSWSTTSTTTGAGSLQKRISWMGSKCQSCSKSNRKTTKNLIKVKVKGCFHRCLGKKFFIKCNFTLNSLKIELKCNVGTLLTSSRINNNKQADF